MKKLNMSNLKTLNSEKRTTDNMGFARCGIEGNLRNILENTRKKPFHFFCKFEKMKMVFARD